MPVAAVPAAMENTAAKASKAQRTAGQKLTSIAEQSLRERERRQKHRKAKAGVWMGPHRQETTVDAAAQIEMQENYLRNYHRPLLQKTATPLAPPDDEQPKPPPTAKR